METVIVPVLQMRKLRLGDDQELTVINENYSPCLPSCKVQLKLWKMTDVASVKKIQRRSKGKV